MNLLLGYDTETTGLPLWHEPSASPGQPHIVQLAAILFDADTGHTLSTIDVTIRPEGWTIPDEVAQIHGITTERAMDVGIPESLAVEMLLELAKGRTRLAHNQSFDQRIVRIACKRFFSDDTVEEWADGSALCTANMATPIMQIPPTAKMRGAGFTKFTTPNLGEAYQHFMGKPLANAHTALADVRACVEIYLAMTAKEQQPEAA